MDAAIGIVGKGFTLLASDMTQINSILVLKDDLDKIICLDDHKAMALCGDPGDRVFFSDYIQKNMNLYLYRSGFRLSIDAAANFARKELADALRKAPFFVDSLIGGYDHESGNAKLFFIDYLASMAQVPYAAHGYGSFFITGLLDRYYKRNMSPEEAIELLKMCISELKTRFVVNHARFLIKLIDQNGIHQVTIN